MRKYYFLLLCFLTFSVLSAQETLSKEEQERREKNIQAGNPFAKFGYKGKVATLSKGKYLEVHDLDSIVTIGSIRYHVDRKQIFGNIVIDTTDMYARPIGDTPSRWLSPDPLSEEFPDWTPYRYGFNNPLRYTDPTGLLEDDYTTKQDGSIEVVKTNDKFDRFFIENKENKVEFIAQIDKNENGLLKLPSKVEFNSSDPESSFKISVKGGNEYRSFIRGDAAAALFGAASDANLMDLTVNGFSLSDGKSPPPSSSHKLGKNGDLRYLNTNIDGSSTNTNSSKFDVTRNSTLTNGLFKYGWKDIISERFGNNQLLPHTSSSKERGIPSDHTTHLHLQGFNPKIIKK
jgi:uncharacterized protein RhaS with RHS repeats